jgi:hypothetical protein
LEDLCEDASGAIILKMILKKKKVQLGDMVWHHLTLQEPGLGGLLSAVTSGELLERVTDSWLLKEFLAWIYYGGKRPLMNRKDRLVYKDTCLPSPFRELSWAAWCGVLIYLLIARNSPIPLFSYVFSSSCLVINCHSHVTCLTCSAITLKAVPHIVLGALYTPHYLCLR